MTFYIQLVISFVVGGVFIALQTLFGERFKGVTRGIILTLPSTLALGLFFIGLTKSPQDVYEASIVLPAAFAIDFIFVAVFALLSVYNLWTALIGSFFCWFVCGFALIIYPPSNYFTSIFIYLAPVIALMYWIVLKLHQDNSFTVFKINFKNTFIRSLLGGTVIVSIVIFSKIFGNVWGAVFSTFPAVFSSTFIIYYIYQGKQVIPAIAKSVFFPGVLVFLVYGLSAGFLSPKIGIWLGTLGAYAAVLIFLAIYYRYSKILSSKIFSKLHK